MRFAFVDTNIWIRTLSQGRPGCEIELLTALEKLVSAGKIVLLLPEVVELEFEKEWRDFKDSILLNMKKLEDGLGNHIKGNKLWSEIEDIHTSVVSFIQQKKQDKLNAADANHKKVLSLLHSPRVVRLPLTADVLFRGKKRLMAGRMPDSSNKAHNDACIIESLVEFFARDKRKPAQVIFCTENTSDFGLKVRNKHVLHPLLLGGMPPSVLTTTLQEAIAWYDSNSQVPELEQAEIEKALEQRLAAANAWPYFGKCGLADCTNKRWIFGPFCHPHCQEQMSTWPEERIRDFRDMVAAVLKTLTHRERKTLKLRTGIGDGTVYTLAECARIFHVSRTRIRAIEAKAVKKMQHPAWYSPIEALFAP